MYILCMCGRISAKITHYFGWNRNFFNLFSAILYEPINKSNLMHGVLKYALKHTFQTQRKPLVGRCFNVLT